LTFTRRTFTAALSLTGLAGFAPLRLIEGAMAQSAFDIRKPVSLPDMALGPADAAVTITALRGLQPRGVSEDQVGIHRHG
jgi:hypothetical protein